VSENSDDRLGTGRSSSPELIAEDDNVPAYVRALIRHFVDLRDNTHGGSTGRHDKEDTSPARSSYCTRWQIKYSAR
jgi:hypothetical protein